MPAWLSTFFSQQALSKPSSLISSLPPPKLSVSRHAIMDATLKSELPSLPSSPLSVLSNSPPPPSPPLMDASRRYPSPSSSAVASGSTSPRKQSDEAEICVRTDGPPPAKRRKLATPKQRSTEYVDMESLSDEDEAQLDRLLSALRKKKKIVVIAGAGISVSAGSTCNFETSLFARFALNRSSNK